MKKDKNKIINNIIVENVELDMDSVFPVTILGTMSSGKSTLINALLGEEILPNKNMACTAKAFYLLDNDNDDETVLKIKYKNGEEKYFTKKIKDELENVNNCDDVSEILLYDDIKGIRRVSRNMLIIDTPGPNNSQDDEHEVVTRNVIDGINSGLIIYVINATQNGIDDDLNLLKEVKLKLNKNPEINIVFVINKVDEIDIEKESILDLIKDTKNYLEKKAEFKKPNIIPVSALSALLFKKAINNEKMTRIEYINFCSCYSLFEPKDFSLNTFSIIDNNDYQTEFANVQNQKYKISDLQSAIENTGIVNLERYIQDLMIEYENLNSKVILKDDEKKENKFSEDNKEFTKIKRVKKNVDKVLDVYFIANMSSGKSTLMNALIHNEMFTSLNAACTSKFISIIENNETSKYYTITDTEVYKAGTFVDFKKLSDFNNENIKEIKITGKIPFADNCKYRIRLFDTPGLNNLQNYYQEKFIYDVINDEKSIIVCVMNAIQFAINADNELLKDIAESMKRGGKQARDRFIFVINKCDALDAEKGETLDKTISDVRDYLLGFGINNPIIIPTSARLALLIHKQKNGQKITMQENSDLFMKNYIIEENELHCENYATLTPAIKDKLSNKVQKYRNSGNVDDEVLIHTGIIPLEETLTKIANEIFDFEHSIVFSIEYDYSKNVFKFEKERETLPQNHRINLYAKNRHLEDTYNSHKDWRGLAEEIVIECNSDNLIIEFTGTKRDFDIFEAYIKSSKYAEKFMLLYFDEEM